MKLKHAILEQMGRDELKAICQSLEISDVDLRSAEAMRAKLSRAHRATPEHLFESLNESQVKVVVQAVGADITGRRQALVTALLDRERQGESVDPQSHSAVRNGKVAAAGENTVERESEAKSIASHQTGSAKGSNGDGDAAACSGKIRTRRQWAMASSIT